MSLKAVFVPECLRLFRYCFLCTCSKKIHETDEIVKMKSLKLKQNIEENKCNSSKIFALPCEKKARTVGLLMAVYNCGIISSFKEIFKQVYLFFLQIESFFNLLTFLGL